jgi:hypothetical protein
VILIEQRKAKTIDDHTRPSVSQTGKSEEDLIREAIEAYLESQNRPLPRSIGIGASDRGDLSDRVDDLLWQDS